MGPWKVRAVKVLRLETRGEGGREDGLGVGQKLQETDRASRKVPEKCPDCLPKGRLERDFFMLHDHVLAREG